jgi:hypothetical protein
MPLNLVEYPKLNGHELSRTSVDVKWSSFGGSLPIIGWSSINFESVRAPGISTGSRSKPQARTRGKVTFPCDITIYEREWSFLRAFLLASGSGFLQSWSEVSSLITITYFEPSMGPGVQLVSLVGAQILSAKQAISDNDDQLARSLTLSVMDILEDDVSSTFERIPIGPSI